MTGIDRDEHSIAVARAYPESADTEYRDGDFLNPAIEPDNFDLLTAVTRAGLRDPDRQHYHLGSQWPAAMERRACEARSSAG